jgi:hypothetical protein
VMKYGPRKIAALLALIVFVTLSSFLAKTYLDRRNPAVLKSLQERSIGLINNPKLYFADKAIMEAEQLRLKMTSVVEIIGKVNGAMQKIELANGIAISLVFQGHTEPAREIGEALAINDSLLSTFDSKDSDAKQFSAYLKNVNEWRVTLGLAYFYNPVDRLMELQKKNARRSALAVLTVLDNPPNNFEDVLNFTLALETAINFNSFSADELNRVIHALSPYENNAGNEWVTNHFKKDQLLIRGYQGYGCDFNGLYQDLATLYAAVGNVDRTLQAIDTLLKYNEPYYQRDYTNLLDNATNIASVFYRSRHDDLLDAFVKGYCNRKKISEIEFYQRLLGRAKPYNLSRNTSYQTFWLEYSNLNLQYGDEMEIRFWFQKFREIVKRSANADERNFQTAISYKDEGITEAYHAEIRGRKYDPSKVYDLFSKSIEAYQNVSQEYLLESIERNVSSNAETLAAPRNSLFLFPDVITQFTPLGARDYHWNYMSGSFVEYLIDQNLFVTFYQQPRELKLVEDWLTDYNMHVFSGDIFMRCFIDSNVLVMLNDAINKLQAGSGMDRNLLYLHLGFYALAQNDQTTALKYYSKLKTENFGNLFRNKVLTGYSNSNAFKLLAKAYTCFIENNKPEEAQRIFNFFRKPANRSSLYAFAVREFTEKNRDGKLTQRLLDSAMVEMSRVENLNSDQPNRARIAIDLVTLDPTDKSIQEAKGIIKNQMFKFIVLQRMARGLAYRNELFMATQVIPSNISDFDQLDFMWNILFGYAERQPITSEWSEYEDTYMWFNKTDFLPYVDETN